MNKLFDLRFVIGAFFTITGLMLLVYGFAEGAPVNKWCGVVFTLFGILMLLLSRTEPTDDPNVPGGH
jgi:uncharacterized membrane protein HdeD (DUF308 family)